MSGITTLTPVDSTDRLGHIATGGNGGHNVMGMISGSAKAVTPFGELSGRTAVTVDHFGADSALIQFTCHNTPVQLAVAGGNFYGLVRQLIALAADDAQAALTAEFDAAIGEVSA